MKANELMIGDWVRVADWVGVREPRKVSGLCDKLVKVGKCDAWFSQDKIEPIPLTAEILEKNGFEWMEENIEYLLPLGNNMEVRAEVVDDFRWDITVYSINADINFYEFEYVHQLQHALRLCGIEKEVLI